MENNWKKIQNSICVLVFVWRNM